MSLGCASVGASLGCASTRGMPLSKASIEESTGAAWTTVASVPLGSGRSSVISSVRSASTNGGSVSAAGTGMGARASALGQAGRSAIGWAVGGADFGPRDETVFCSSWKRCSSSGLSVPCARFSSSDLSSRSVLRMSAIGSVPEYSFLLTAANE
jgi:hypothetical protein